MTEKYEAAASTLDPNACNPAVESRRKRTLGNVRLMHHDTNAMILVPTPSSDPNDPLNWYVVPVTVSGVNCQTASERCADSLFCRKGQGGRRITLR